MRRPQGPSRAAADALTQAAGRGPVRYLRSSALDKEDYIAELRRREPIEQGLLGSAV